MLPDGLDEYSTEQVTGTRSWAGGAHIETLTTLTAEVMGAALVAEVARISKSSRAVAPTS